MNFECVETASPDWSIAIVTKIFAENLANKHKLICIIEQVLIENLHICKAVFTLLIFFWCIFTGLTVFQGKLNFSL
jgi:hypothetical protein